MHFGNELVRFGNDHGTGANSFPTCRINPSILDRGNGHYLPVAPRKIVRLLTLRRVGPFVIA